MQKWINMQHAATQWSQVQTKSRELVHRFTWGNKWMQRIAAKRWSLFIIAIGFLLGRAVILEQFTPFALAFFAVVYFLRRDISYYVCLSILVGSFTSMHGNTVLLLTQILVFWLIQRSMERYERAELSYVPVAVLATAFIVNLFAFFVKGEMSWYALTLTAVEAALCFILCLIFVQALPVFSSSRKHFQLKNEEIICLIILLASVMTGTVGWVINGISVEHVLSRYLILLFAFAGGAPLGATVGVVTGLILSLADAGAIYQISLLAFAGMLAGLLKDGKRIGVALGMLLGSSILSLYVGEREQFIASISESGIAAALFMITPRALIQTIAQYIPGTQEHAKTQIDYAKKVRDVIAGRIEQFSEMFRQLSGSFSHMPLPAKETSGEEQVSQLMNSVAEKNCESCWKKRKCWDDQFYKTYKYMTDMIEQIEEKPQMGKRDIPLEWKHLCVKTEAVLDTMKHEYAFYKNDLHWRKQIRESRQLVANQLTGVSKVMEDLSREIKREGQELFLQEEQIRLALSSLGLSIYNVEIISLDEGNVLIEMVHQYTKGLDECKKIIAPMLSKIVGENIVVKRETPSGDGYYSVEFGSAKEYEIETGIASAAKGGELLSGDSFSSIELGNGKFAVAISDGMGNGERANMESRTALMILQQLLQSGIDEKLAIQSVNSVLLLRSTDEMYATIDMALIDLYSAETTFLKIGSTPSFIKRGSEVIAIHGENLPVGILQDIDVDLIHLQLLPGDILIMMTDGIFDAPGHAVNKELWMKRIIQEMATTEPQEIADCLLETVVRYHHGEINDDMTVVVARIESFRPEWAAFHWAGAEPLERPRTVS